ncbi:MAG TPA: efflux RND transporter periplasmic adaptor subunit [Stellaceae bacterium]|jgi:multidrug efflux system membrane fusion protein|nr:efflux RND transporter periplasmic adaptor subunit [Stellaceae bacterium]
MVRRAIGATAIVVIAAAVLIWWHGLGGGNGPQATAQTPAPGIPVTPGTVVAQDVPVFLHGIGTVQAYNMVAIKSRVDGQIVKVYFKEGQEVREGEPLFQIDPRPYQAALEQAQAAKQKDEAQLKGAELDLVRYSKLLGTGYQTRQSYDQQQAQVGSLQAAIKADEAQIDAAKLNLGYTDIRAPIDGRLGARLVDKGNLVHANDNTALVTITELKPIFVSFTLPQSSLDEVRDAQTKHPLAVRAYTSDGEKLLAEGKLTLIDNQIDQTTGTIHMKARFDNQDERLWPGEFVSLRVILRVQPKVATVPSQTIQEGPNGRYAYIIKSDDTVERRAVDVASVQDGIAVITKGLKPGERVVVEGQFRLTEGARVRLLATRPASGAG